MLGDFAVAFRPELRRNGRHPTRMASQLFGRHEQRFYARLGLAIASPFSKASFRLEA